MATLFLSPCNNTVVKIQPSSPKGLRGFPRETRATKSVLTKSSSIPVSAPTKSVNNSVSNNSNLAAGLNKLLQPGQHEIEPIKIPKKDEDCALETQASTEVSNSKTLPSGKPTQPAEQAKQKTKPSVSQRKATSRSKSEAAKLGERNSSEQGDESKSSGTPASTTRPEDAPKLFPIPKPLSVSDTAPRVRYPVSGILVPNEAQSFDDTVEISMEKNTTMESHIALLEQQVQFLDHIVDVNFSKCASDTSESNLGLSNNNLGQSLPRKKMRKRRKPKQPGQKIGDESKNSFSKTGLGKLRGEKTSVAEGGSHPKKKRRFRSATKKRRRSESKISKRAQSLSDRESPVRVSERGNQNLRPPGPSSHTSRAPSTTSPKAHTNPSVGDSEVYTESMMTSIEAVKISTKGKKKKKSKLSISQKKRWVKSAETPSNLLEKEPAVRPMENVYKDFTCGRNLPQKNVSSYSTNTGKPIRDSWTDTNDPEKLLEDFRERMGNIKGKSSILATQVKVKAYPDERKSPKTIQSLPKTYQQLGLSPLVRSPSSTNYFPLISDVLSRKSKKFRRKSKGRVSSRRNSPRSIHSGSKSSRSATSTGNSKRKVVRKSTKSSM